MESPQVTPNPSAPPPPPGFVAMSAPPPPPGFVSGGAASAPPAEDLSANPNGEGTYQMQGPKGPIGVPYSKVEGAKAQGYKLQGDGQVFGSLTHQSDASRYASDRASDPNNANPSAMDKVGNALAPAAAYGRGFFKQGAQTVGGILKILGDATSSQGASPDVVDRAMGKPQAAQPQAENPVSAHLKAAADWMNQGNEEAGFWEHLGGFGENIAELMTPEALGTLAKGAEATKASGAVKAAAEAGTAAQRYADAGKIAQVLQKYPRLASLVGIGAAAARRGALEAGLQTYVKTGGDADAAGSAAVMGAAAGGIGAPALTAAGDAVSSAMAKRAATKEMVGGVEATVPAEVRNVKETPQQTQGKQAIRNAAQDTLGQRLQEVNESRAVPEETQPLLPARTGPFEFTLKGLPTQEERVGEGVQAAAKRPQAAFKPPQYLTGSRPTPQTPGTEGSFGSDISTDVMPQPGAEKVTGGGTLTTQDPNIVRQHISNINDLVDSPDFANLPETQKSQILEARADAQRQLGQYHQEVTDGLRAGKPNLPQIDIPKTIKTVGSYSEAARHLEGIATDGYNSISDALQLNDISGGKFNTIRNANKEAWAAYKSATSPEAEKAAEQTIDSTNQQMMDMLKNDIHGAVTPKELAGFNDAYAASQRLKYVANAVDRAFSGNESNAARSWEYRGFNGTQLMSNLNRLQQKFGRQSLERVVGKANLDTLFQVAELNRTGAARARFGAAIKPVAEALIRLHAGSIALGGYLGHVTGVGYEAGAAAGALLPAATKRVMNAVLSDPNTAQNLIFAIKAGARPDNYGPMIATLIQRHETEQARAKNTE